MKAQVPDVSMRPPPCTDADDLLRFSATVGNLGDIHVRNRAVRKTVYLGCIEPMECIVPSKTTLLLLIIVVVFPLREIPTSAFFDRGLDSALNASSG